MPHIEINTNKCKSCYLCIDACPFKLIQKNTDETGLSGEATVKFIDKDKKCTGCAMCALICPDIAIEGVYK